MCGWREDHRDGETKAHARAVRAELREADRLLAEGRDVAEVERHLQVNEQTYHRWRNQCGAMKADDVKRLKELEVENARQAVRG
jgi:transposase-like protein